MKNDFITLLFVVGVLGSALALLAMFPWLILVGIVLIGVHVLLNIL